MCVLVFFVHILTYTSCKPRYVAQLGNVSFPAPPESTLPQFEYAGFSPHRYFLCLYNQSSFLP